MAAVYAFFIAVFVYKDLTLRDVPRVLLQSANMSAMLLYIITNAILFSFVLTNEQIPQHLADWLVGMGLGWIGFLLVVNILLLLAGNVMEPSSIILIMAPILFPVAVKLGIDPVHFGILIIVNMEVGMCHPPVGPEPLRRLGDHEDGNHRAHGRGLAVAADDARLPRHRHLLAGAVALAAAPHAEVAGAPGPALTALVATNMNRFRQKNQSPASPRARTSATQASAAARSTPWRTAALRPSASMPAPNESGS
jgi:hypothetical protein